MPMSTARESVMAYGKRNRTEAGRVYESMPNASYAEKKEAVDAVLYEFVKKVTER